MSGVRNLRTRRLLLRRPSSADVGAILAIHRQPAAIAHNPSDAIVDQVQAQSLLRRWLDHWEQSGFGYWTVRRQDQAAVLGFCGIKNMQLHDQPILNLFYRLDPSTWGQGIATEAASAVVDWAENHQPDRPVIARVRPDNLASARVAVKAGLHRAEHLDDHGEDGLDLIYRSQWPSQPPIAH